MKENKLTILIRKPVSEVFIFSTDPENTPKWIDSISAEEIDGFPIKIGSIYKNANLAGEWSEYIVSDFKENSVFELSDKNSSYKVRYTYRPISDQEMELEYFEWMEEGELGSPFTMEPLEKMKTAIEAR